MSIACDSPARLFSRLLVLLLLLGVVRPVAAQAPPLSPPLPNAEETQRALKAVKDELVAKLQSDEYLGPESRLATRLSQLEGEELGNFFGSVAGGDANAAFESIGGIGARLFVADIQGKWAKVEFEGKELLEYVPVDAGECKEILVDLWWHGGHRAAIRAERMLREQSVDRLKTLSRDAVSKSLDWVLKDTIGEATGGHFLKLVEAEIWMLKVAERYQDQAFLNKLAAAQQFYNQRRLTQSPASAYNAVLNRAELGVYDHALYEKHQDFPALFESQFRRTSAGASAKEKTRSLRARARERARAEAKTALQQEVDKIRQLAKQLLKDMADSDETVRRLHQANSAVQFELARMKIAVQFLKGRRSKLAGLQTRIDILRNDLSNLNAAPRAGQKTLQQLADATPEIVKLVGQWDDRERGVKDEVRGLRDAGRALSKRVRSFCDATSMSTEARRKQGLSLIKEIRKVSAARQAKWRTTNQNALKHLAEISGFQFQANPTLQRKDDVEKVLKDDESLENDLEQIRTKAGDAETTYDLAASRCVSVIRDLRKAMGKKPGELMACEILKRDLDDEMDGFMTTGVRQDVNDGIKQAEETLSKLDPQISKLEDFQQRLQSWLAEAKSVLDFESSKELDLMYRLRARFEKYQGEFRNLVRAARQCAKLDPSEVMKLDVDEAKRLLREAQDHGGKLLDRWIELEKLVEDVKKTTTTFADLRRTTAAALNGLPETLAECEALSQQSTQRIDPGLQLAAAHADREYVSLQNQFKRALSLVGVLRGMRQSVSQVKDSVNCENLHGSADRTAQLVEDAAFQARQAGAAMTAIYNAQTRAGHNARMNVVLGRVQSLLNSLQKTLPLARGELARTSAIDLQDWRNDKQRLWREMRQHANEAMWRVERIELLMSPYLADWKEPQQIVAAAGKVREIIDSRLKDASPLVELIGNALPGVILDRREVQHALPQLEAALGKLRQCCTVGDGVAIQRLLGYNSDVPGWNARLTELTIEARDCVNSIGEYCRTRFPDPNTPVEPIPSPDRSQPPDLSDLFAGVDRGGKPEGDDPNQPPDLGDLIGGVERDPPPDEPGTPVDPLPSGSGGKMDGLYQLARDQGPNQPQVAMPVLLRWRGQSEGRAAAVLEISNQISAEMRGQISRLGIPNRLPMTAQLVNGEYVIKDPQFNRVAQKVLLELAKIASAIGETFGGLGSIGAGGDAANTKLQLHSAVIRVRPMGANLRVQFDFDYTLTDSSGTKRQTPQVICIGTKR